MASSLILNNLCFSSPYYSLTPYRNQTLPLSHSPKLQKQSNLPLMHYRVWKPRFLPVIFAAQSNFFKVIQTVYKVGRDGIEAGTNLVPDSVPRPIAKVSVTVVALSLSLFVLKSFLSTAFFALATMGLGYFVFIALNKDDKPSGSRASTSTYTEDKSSTSTDDEALEEARRIMDKYK